MQERLYLCNWMCVSMYVSYKRYLKRMDENTVQVRGASASLRKKNNKVDNVQKSGTKQHYMYIV